MVELTDSNFDSLVTGSNDLWLVEFYAPVCNISYKASSRFVQSRIQRTVPRRSETQHRALCRAVATPPTTF